jgi:hypothetical protein
MHNNPTGVLAWISIVLNILVIVTFLKIRKSKGTLPQGAIQLLILAVSEAAASLSWALGMAYFLLLENTSLSRNSTVYILLLIYGGICEKLTRFLTLYIAVSRGSVLWSFRLAHQNLQKTEKAHICETILYGVLLFVGGSIISGVINAFFISINLIVDNVMIALLATYIIWKTHTVDAQSGLSTEVG